MTRKEQKVIGDVLGEGRLSVDAIDGGSDIAEGLHHAIITVGGVLSKDELQTTENGVPRSKRTGAISGLGC